GDRPLAQRHGKRGIIAVLRILHGRAATAAHALAAAGAFRALDDLLAEIRRPDDVAADAHAAEHLRNDRALARARDPRLVEARALHTLRLAAHEHADNPAVDHRADRGADHAADR